MFCHLRKIKPAASRGVDGECEKYAGEIDIQYQIDSEPTDVPRKK
jgi:hypothetical protein